MIVLESILVAVATYSVIPVPQFEWNEHNMKYAIGCFPVVGIVCGLLLWAWTVLAMHLEVSGVLYAAAAAALPLLITGGIHMDGYMDTVDAIASHQSRERKLEILKDPNCGAFAVVYCGIYLLLWTGLAYELYTGGRILAICPLFVLSRSLSGLCAVNLPNARKSGMLCAYTENADRRTVNGILILAAVLSTALAVKISLFAGGMAALAALVTMLVYRTAALRIFGGVTGDTSGFFLQVCELAGLLGAWIGGLL